MIWRRNHYYNYYYHFLLLFLRLLVFTTAQLKVLPSHRTVCNCMFRIVEFSSYTYTYDINEYLSVLNNVHCIMHIVVGSLGLGNLGWTKVTYVVYPHR